jgi:hypothetical protein
VTNQRNYNSIVFITTLGVYLGLVLVGGAPQITAQTARAISNSQKTSLRDTNREFSDVPLQKFLEQLKLEVRNGGLDLSKPAQLSIKGTPRDGSLLSGKLSVTAESENSIVLLGLAREFLSAVDESHLFRSFSDRIGETLAAASIDVSHGQLETTFRISLKADNAVSARMLANGFKNLFSTAKVIRRGTPEVSFYENAAVNAENDQVTIVTHMPRAALDEFLNVHAL